MDILMGQFQLISILDRFIQDEEIHLGDHLDMLKIIADKSGAVKFYLSGRNFNQVRSTLSVSSTALVDEEGSVVVNFNRLHKVVREILPTALIRIMAIDEMLVLVADDSKFSLSCLPADDFPIMSGGDLRFTFSLAASDLRGLIDRTRFAIYAEGSRPNLMGMFLHHTERSEGVDVLRAVATDGHRLACVETPFPAGAAGMPGVIVPRKTVAELRKLIDEIGADVTISLFKSKISFAFDGTVLISELIDGSFPDYVHVIPVDNDKVIEVDTKLFTQAVKRVSAILDDLPRIIKIAMGEGKVILSAVVWGDETAEEDVKTDYNGCAMELGIVSEYLLSVLESIKDETTVISMKDPMSVVVFSGKNDTSAIYAVMPYRLDNAQMH